MQMACLPVAEVPAMKIVQPARRDCVSHIGFLVRERLGKTYMRKTRLPVTQFARSLRGRLRNNRSLFSDFACPCCPMANTSHGLAWRDGDLYETYSHHWLHDALNYQCLV